MLKPRSSQTSFYGSYLYDRIVPADHLLRKINAVVDFSFVNDLVKDRYTPDFGRPAENPEFMLRLCLLQYIYGDSDREVIANAKMHLAYKYFLGLAVDEEAPDDTTISYFRAKRLGEDKFRLVFEKIVQQCIDKGLVTGRRQIIDSTHIVADMAINSLSGLIKLCRRNVLQTVKNQDTQIAGKLGINELEVIKQDRFTKMEEGLEKEIAEARTLLDGVANELKAKKLKVTPELQKDLELLEKAVADRADEAKDRLVSPVDADARMGRKEHKSWAGYKGHVIVEEDTEIITAVETTPANQADGNQLKPLLNRQEKANGLIPDEISGDKGYDSGANLEHLANKDINGYISLTRKLNNQGPNNFTVDDFQYDASNNTLTCPGGYTITHHHLDIAQTRKGRIFEFKHTQCSNCELKTKCFNSNSKVHGRAVHVSFYESYYRQMKERMESEGGKAAYRNRYKIEHKIADLARYCGMRYCRYRGLTRAKIHTLLSATVSNIKRMAKLLWKQPEILSECLPAAC